MTYFIGTLVDFLRLLQIHSRTNMIKNIKITASIAPPAATPMIASLPNVTLLSRGCKQSPESRDEDAVRQDVSVTSGEPDTSRAEPLAAHCEIKATKLDASKLVVETVVKVISPAYATRSVSSPQKKASLTMLFSVKSQKHCLLTALTTACLVSVSLVVRINGSLS